MYYVGKKWITYMQLDDNAWCSGDNAAPKFALNILYRLIVIVNLTPNINKVLRL